MGTSLGDLQHLVLLAVRRLGEEAYGVSVRDEIEATGGRVLSLGAVYSTLRRLRKQGLVTARKGTPEERRGGRAKTFFSVSERGRELLREAQLELARMSSGLEDLPLGALGDAGAASDPAAVE